MPVLECNNLTKIIRNKLLVNNISFSIEEGEIVGLVGPNGSGKTTIMKMIVGLTKLSSGHVYINGYDIQKNFTKAIKSVGSIIDFPDAYTYLSGYDNLKIICNNFTSPFNNKIQEVIDLVNLQSSINNKVSTYSLGMRQRLGIASSLLNNPNLLILDEPTNGLDMYGILEFENLIKYLSKKKISILLSSHNFSLLQKICHRIIAIKEGTLIIDSSIDDFKIINGQKLNLEEAFFKRLEGGNNDKISSK